MTPRESAVKLRNIADKIVQMDALQDDIYCFLESLVEANVLDEPNVKEVNALMKRMIACTNY